MRPFTELSTEGSRFLQGSRLFNNGKYQVDLRKQKIFTVLSIRREDRKHVMDWRDMQWIKNQLLGPEREALQLFPAESRLVDTSNQYYLFGLPEGMKFPAGFSSRAVAENVSIHMGSGKSSQRPFADHVRPDDLAESEAKLVDAFVDLLTGIEESAEKM